MFVYIIINDVNCKYYIGKTKEKNLQRYWQKQKYRVFTKSGHTSKPHLYNAVRKHGWDHFYIFPLEYVMGGHDRLLQREKELIEGWKAREVGYNICAGGRGATGWKPTAEQRAKISAALKGNAGRFRNGHTINRGRHRSPEAVAKAKTTLLQRPDSLERVRNAFKNTSVDGKERSLSAIRNLSDASEQKRKESLRHLMLSRSRDSKGRLLPRSS